MTDEELKNKCTERAKIFQQAMESCHSSSPMDCIEWFADRIAELEKEIAELYHTNNLMFIIGTNNDFVPQDVGESVYYLSDRMKKALDSLCFSPDEEEKQLL